MIIYLRDLGALDRGSLMSHVEFKKLPCHMSLSMALVASKNADVTGQIIVSLCHVTIFSMSIRLMSHVGFEKWACRPVEF